MFLTASLLSIFFIIAILVDVKEYFIVLFVCLFAFSRATPVAHGGSQARGLIGTVATGLRQSHSNAESLTHWARPGIEPETSWFLVGFISAVPWRELQKESIYFIYVRITESLCCTAETNKTLQINYISIK